MAFGYWQLALCSQRPTAKDQWPKTSAMEGYDISRVGFDPKKHYAGVRMQQGRVLTDDDWNENERIENEERRRSRVDIIGAFGSPDNGFKITNLRMAGGFVDFDIHNGTLHLGGLRLELELAEPFRQQKDWLQQPPFALPIGPQFDLVYLETWQQSVSAVEDGELFEMALGGPDTTTRVRTMRRVKIFPNIGSGNCPRAWVNFRNALAENNLGKLGPSHEIGSDARLQVGYNPNAPAEDLCSPSAMGGYLGAENQAIRVQLLDTTHLTWGFDNASPLYRVTVGADRTTITMLTEPKDQHHFPLSGQVVEILPWSAVLPNGEKVAEIQGHLSKVAASYDPDDKELTLLSALPAGFGAEWTTRGDAAALALPSKLYENDPNPPAVYFYMRVWDRGSDLSSAPSLPYTPGTPLPLGNTGIEVTLDGTIFLAGDYWVIAARPETPTQVVPWALEDPTGLPPNGIRRFVAPLGIIRWQMDANQQLTGAIITDCRRKFRPLTDQECCCTFTVGDGVNSRGDFDSIEEALANLPDEGGKICVLPGEHLANVLIAQRRQVHIVGCGERSIVRPRPQSPTAPVFWVQNSKSIKIESLNILAVDGIGILVDDSDDGKPSCKITMSHNHIVALVNCIRVQLVPEMPGDNEIQILHNHLLLLNKLELAVAIFSLADAVFIAWNKLEIVPARRADDPTDPDDPDDPTDPDDPCDKPERRYRGSFEAGRFYRMLLRRLQFAWAINRKLNYVAWGGIQVGGTSERVRILENDIIGGRGHGVTLGHLPEIRASVGDSVALFTSLSKLAYNHVVAAPTDLERKVLTDFFNKESLGTVHKITIERNRISHTGLAGIGVIAFFEEKMRIAIKAVDLTIYRNQITGCARQLPPELPEDMVDDVGFGGVALADTENCIIHENRIEDNGKWDNDERDRPALLPPVCGIFILAAEQTDISHNRVLNNGEPFPAEGRQVARGHRGGIVVKMAFSLFRQMRQPNNNTASTAGLNQKSKADSLLSFKNPWVGVHDELPAARLHGNIVCQPAGHALWLMAMGPVSVMGNQFTSLGVYPFRLLYGPNTNNQALAQDLLGLLGASVFILDLGVSKDIMGALMLNFQKLITKGQAGQTRITAQFSRTLQFILDLQWLPPGNVLFTNNQCMLDLREPERSLAISSLFVASLDDINFADNQTEVASYFSFLQSGQEGDNPATGTASAPVTTRVVSDLLFVNTILVGISVRANSNRFQEGTTMGLFSLFNTRQQLLPLLSLISIGYLNTVVGNQSSYCLVLAGKKRIEEHNLIFHDDMECPCLKLNSWKEKDKNEQAEKEAKCRGGQG